jgi:hypothetical protein
MPKVVEVLRDKTSDKSIGASGTAIITPPPPAWEIGESPLLFVAMIFA